MQGCERARQLGLLVLGVLADWALPHIVGDVGLQAFPHEKPFDALVGGRGAGVTTDRTVMQFADDLGVQGRVLADSKAVLLADEPLVELEPVVVG